MLHFYSKKEVYTEFTVLNNVYPPLAKRLNTLMSDLCQLHPIYFSSSWLIFYYLVIIRPTDKEKEQTHQVEFHYIFRYPVFTCIYDKLWICVLSSAHVNTFILVDSVIGILST